MLPISYKILNNDGEIFQASGNPNSGIQKHILGLKRFQGLKGLKEPICKHCVDDVFKFSNSKCQMFIW